jgi:hypothetical protein
MVSLHIYIVVKGFWQHALWDFIIIDRYTNRLANNAKELTPFRFEFKWDTSRIKNIFYLYFVVAKWPWTSCEGRREDTYLVFGRCISLY